MEKLVVQGKIEGKHRRGRSPTRWIDTIENLLDAEIKQAVRQTFDRTSWRDTVRSVNQQLNSQA